MTQNAPVATEAPARNGGATSAPAPGPTPIQLCPVAVVPTPAPGEPAAVANYNTTINSGPGTNYVVYRSSWAAQPLRSSVRAKTACGGRSAYRLLPMATAGWMPPG